MSQILRYKTGSIVPNVLMTDTASMVMRVTSGAVTQCIHHAEQANGSVHVRHQNKWDC